MAHKIHRRHPVACMNLPFFSAAHTAADTDEPSLPSPKIESYKCGFKWNGISHKGHRGFVYVESNNLHLKSLGFEEMLPFKGE